MFAITGAFGQTGLALSQALLDAGQPIRMIVRRDDDQAADWRSKGAEVVVADLGNVAEMTQAFQNAAGAYLMNPPAYFVPDLYAQARRVHASLIAAANAAALPHAVALSSVGAQHAAATGNILTTHDFEQQLSGYRGKVTILRAANFMENWAWSLEPVLQRGVLPSMFRPIDTALPMVSAVDIGRCAAALLTAPSGQRCIVELHGPQDYSPNDAAAALSTVLGKPIAAVAASDATWAAEMLGAGFPQATVAAFVEMFAGFNSGLIAFEGHHRTLRGSITLHDAIATMLRNRAPH